MIAPENRPRVVIVGAGFGGLWAARALSRSPVEVLLVDRNNYHTFSPMLYQVVAAELAPEQIAYPVRGILRKQQRNADFVRAEVTQIDFERKVVETNVRKIPYDFLVLATGSITKFLKVPGAAEYAWTLDSLEQAVALRNQILDCFELAAQETDPQRRSSLLTFAIVGGGPTGVELAGALIELIRGTLHKDYPTLDTRQAQVVLLQSGSSLLAGMMSKRSRSAPGGGRKIGDFSAGGSAAAATAPPLQPSPLERSQIYTLKQLRKMGVKVYLETKASRVTKEAVYLQDGRIIPTHTAIWTVGVQADPLAERWGLPTSTQNRVAVLPTLQLVEYPEVYVVGDLALAKKDGQPVPMVAPAAIQQGTVAGRNIERQLMGRYPVSFRYWNKGNIAMIGRNAAAAQIGKLKFEGFLAWISWLIIHLVYLPGFRNRLLVLIDWLRDYFFHARVARLILRPKMISPQTRVADYQPLGK